MIYPGERKNLYLIAPISAVNLTLRLTEGWKYDRIVRFELNPVKSINFVEISPLLLKQAITQLS